jgi:uncharacterized protein (TIGR04255 family)
MKKIIRYSGKTLRLFSLHISYEGITDRFSIDNFNKLANSIDEYYPTKPMLNLYPRIAQPFQLKPLDFKNKQKTNKVELGKDFCAFKFTEYQSFLVELPKMISVINGMNKHLSLPNFNSITLMYVDEFKISEKDFKYSNHFTFPNLNPDEIWNIKFDDITLGFVCFSEVVGDFPLKVVLRFKGRGLKEGIYTFQVETVASISGCSISPSNENLENILLSCHDYANNYFIEFLNESYRKILEMEIAETE